MREKYLFEPPQPKKTKKKSNPNEKEKINFLWLNDKGNDFFRNRDYQSAIHAYEEVIKAQPDFLASYSNLSIIYLKTLDFKRSLDYCYKCVNIYEEMDETSKELRKNKKIIEIVKKRVVFILLNIGKSSEALNYLRKINCGEDEESQQRIQEDIRRLSLRIESNVLKRKGDLYLRKNKYNLSKEEYLKSLDIDATNEKAAGNLSVLYKKINDLKNMKIQSMKILDHLYEFGKKFEIDS